MLAMQNNVDTNFPLEDVDITNLSEVYIQTLTKKEDLLQTNNGYLVKQQDTFFAFVPTLATLATTETEKNQTISKTLQECYTGIIASLLLAGESLPTEIKIGACIHHPSNQHWTTLITKCTHDKKVKEEYQALYEEYQADPSFKEREHLLNAANNFLKDKKQIIFASDSEKTPSNWALPLTHVKIALTHYDSLSPNTRTNAYEEIKSASRSFREKHQASFNSMPCEKQKGSTCGDWSVYNAFFQGFLKKGLTPPSSENLRFLTANRSIDNVKNILSSSEKKKLKAVSEKDQISFPLASEEQQTCRALSRTIPPLLTQSAGNTAIPLLTPLEKGLTPPSSENLRFLTANRSIDNVKNILSSSEKKKLKAVSEKDQISFLLASEEQQTCRALSRTIPPLLTQSAGNTAIPLLTPLEKCNDLYPTIHLISKMLFTLLFAYIASSLIPNIILPSFLSFSLGLVIGFFTYDSFISDCFGKKEIMLKPVEGDLPTYEKGGKPGFIQALGFTLSPYHKELKALEKEIANIIGEHQHQKNIIRCFIKYKLYAEAPECFYKSDISKINSPTYISDEEKTLDSITAKSQGAARFS